MVSSDDLAIRAERRADDARQVLANLDLLSRWKRHGDPVVCGSVAYGLVVEPDIDMEIFAAEPSIDAAFEVLREVAKVPGVVRCAFTNDLDGPAAGIYCRIVYDHAGVRWNLDNWLLPRDHPGPFSARLVQPMLGALTAETRRAVLEIKETALARKEPVQGIWVYRAVLTEGIRGYADFHSWLRGVDTSVLTNWSP